jgi:hypothetical protein
MSARAAHALQGPWPLAGVVLAAVLGRWHAAQPVIDLRLCYGLSMLPVLLAYQWLLAREKSAGWLGLVTAAYIAFELLVIPLHLDQHVPYINRFEHLAGFALLTTICFTLAQLVHRAKLTRVEQVAIAVGVWGIGWGNEAIEYFARLGTPFFSEDTVLDLLMNTCAIAAVTLLASRTRA